MQMYMAKLSDPRDKVTVKKAGASLISLNTPATLAPATRMRNKMVTAEKMSCVRSGAK